MSEKNARGNQNCPTLDAGASSRDSSRADTGGSTDVVAQRKQTGQGARLIESNDRAVKNSSDPACYKDTVTCLGEAVDGQLSYSDDAGDQEIGANGGIEPCHRCETDLLVQRSSTDHDFWCHGCGKHFDAGDRSGTAVPLPDGGHPPGCSPESSTADSSPDGEWFVVDEARPAVVDGPLPMARAKTLANEYGPDHITVARSAIELLENASDATVRWETDDVDVVTDGGKSVSEADLARLSNISVREVAIRDGDEEVAWKATVENDSSVPDCRGDTATEAIDVLLEFLWGSEHTSPSADDGGSR